MNVLDFELDVSVVVDTEYYVPAGVQATFTLDGTGVWEYDTTGDSDWVQFAAGVGKNFTADIPHSGHIRINRTSGTIQATMIVKESF
jgi:hypothetical protein